MLKKLYKIKHLRDKSILKGRSQQKKLDEEIIKNIKNENKKEIYKLQENFKKNILEIRAQERKNYEPRIKELNNEIARLFQEKIDNKEYYSAILQYGVTMEETGAQAADFFQRARLKITEFMNYFKSAEQSYGEAIRLIDSGKSKITYAQNLIEQEKPKLLKGIK